MDYQDIIHLSRPQSKKHPQMSMQDRAAQFSPFAALTGHDEAISETARLTDVRLEPDEERVEQINRNLQEIAQRLDSQQSVEITYFEPDKHKAGGRYCLHCGVIKQIDDRQRVLLFTDGFRVEIDDIYEIQIKRCTDE